MRRALPAFPLTLLLLTAPLASAADAPTPGKPFTQRIPGSDVTFTMMPIPAGKRDREIREMPTQGKQGVAVAGPLPLLVRARSATRAGLVHMSCQLVAAQNR